MLLLCSITEDCSATSIYSICSALLALPHHRGLLCSACFATSQRAALLYLLYHITEGCSTQPALPHYRGLLCSACSAYHKGLHYLACSATSQRATLLCLLSTSQRAAMPHRRGLLCYFVLVHISTSDPTHNHTDLICHATSIFILNNS